MEADVAIHKPEKWAESEASCYEQAGKVKFVYSSRLKERSARRSAQKIKDSPYLLKPSKSYDNDLETSTGKEFHYFPQTRDDSGLGYKNVLGEISDSSHMGESGSTFLSQTYCIPFQLDIRAGFIGAEHNYPVAHRETIMPKDKPSPKQSHQGKIKRSLKQPDFDTLHIMELSQSSSIDKTTNRPTTFEMVSPFEFQYKNDQIKSHASRPITLSSTSSKHSMTRHTSCQEKTSPLVILEVKDGPTFIYKPSNRIVTDASVVETSGMGINTSPTLHSISSDALSILSTDTFKNANRPADYSEISPKIYSSVSGHLTTRSPSLLPRAIGLRRPDLSVLKKSSRVYEEKVLSDETEASLACTSSVSKTPKSTELALAPKTEFLSSPLQSAAVPGPALFISKTSEHVNSALDADVVELPKSTFTVPDPALRQPSSCVVLKNHENEGFLNTSEIIQQRAGIKHDDIVVGPRRHMNALASETDEDSGLRKCKEEMTFEPFVGDSSLIDKPYLPPRKPVSGIPQSYRGQRKKAPEMLIFPEHNIKENKTKSDVKAVRSQEVLSANMDTRRSDSAESGPTSSAENSLERMASVGGSLDRGRWRPKERKSGIHRPIRGKPVQLGYTEIKSSKAHRGELSPKTRGNSEQLSTFSKLSVETKLSNKPTSLSPARQKQPISPSGYQKTKLPTGSSPSKKQHPIPSRLNMLSNISVPMSYDPPVKKVTARKEQEQLKSLDSSLTTFENKKESSNALLPNDSVRLFEGQVEQLSTSTLVLVKSSHCETPLNSQNQSIKAEEIQPGLPTKKAEEDSSSPNTPNTSRKKIPVLQKQDNSVKPVPNICSVINDSEKIGITRSLINSSNIEPCFDPGKDIETFDGSQTPPAKPRLHRSVEHLIGDAKLSVFNSTENIQHFENSGTKAKAFQDSEDVISMDSVGQLKKDKRLAKIGILRRGSDRAELYRRGSDRGIPICRNDPSVEDLKKATSLKELCQSVASLLNIDNERAAEMITTSLSQRQDLVEGLDADAILDYLSHHGVLDPSILVGLDEGVSTKQRNSAILRHVEEHGTTAVALFINALRQSGQLHLASSLDTDQRIKPVSGDGYFGKERHKGEVTVRVEMEALKILAPREPRTDKIVDTSLLSSPARHSGTTAHATMNSFLKDEDEDSVKAKSCWCFCFSRKSKSKRVAQSLKKDSTQNKVGNLGECAQEAPLEDPAQNLGHEEVDRHNPNVKPHRTKSKDKNKKDKDPKTKASSGDVVSDSTSCGKTKDNSGKKAKSKSKSKHLRKSSAPDVNPTNPHNAPGDLNKNVQEKVVFNDRHLLSQQVNNGVSTSSSPGKKPDKDSWDPIVMEYDPKLELIKLRAGQEELASPTRQYGQMGMICEQWKSSGRHYQQKASLLCNSIIQELHTEIIKYFEQDRSTLVLDVISDGSAILIINICMQKAQVRRLQQEAEDGTLISKMEDMFFSKVDITAFDIRGVKLKIVLDEEQVNTALSELS